MKEAPEAVMDRVGDNVRILREKKGYTQVDLVTATGLAHRTISNVERDASNVTIRTLVIIANALDVSIQDLLKKRKEVND